ncbi:MAG: hypothetical protein HY924_07630 [Elusimicrobia bacterium]|nr:hypothetical protein [Elusimicrobiota bacterium]
MKMTFMPLMLGLALCASAVPSAQAQEFKMDEARTLLESMRKFGSRINGDQGSALKTVMSDDRTLYKRVCRERAAAELQEGLTGKPRCVFIERNLLAELVRSDLPCAQSAKGQFLEGLFGRDCEEWTHRQISETSFVYVQTCDGSAWARFQEGLTGKPACTGSYAPASDGAGKGAAPQSPSPADQQQGRSAR